MPVKRLDNGDVVITIPNPHVISGHSSRTLQKAFVDEFTKFLDGQERADHIGGWPPHIEDWEPEGANAVASVAPDGRTAVILQTQTGNFAAKWRDKDGKERWITRYGVTYTQDELIQMFRRAFYKA